VARRLGSAAPACLYHASAELKCLLPALCLWVAPSCYAPVACQNTYRASGGSTSCPWLPVLLLRGHLHALLYVLEEALHACIALVAGDIEGVLELRRRLVHFATYGRKGRLSKAAAAVGRGGVALARGWCGDAATTRRWSSYSRREAPSVLFLGLWEHDGIAPRRAAALERTRHAARRVVTAIAVRRRPLERVWRRRRRLAARCLYVYAAVMVPLA